MSDSSAELKTLGYLVAIESSFPVDKRDVETAMRLYFNWPCRVDVGELGEIDCYPGDEETE